MLLLPHSVVKGVRGLAGATAQSTTEFTRRPGRSGRVRGRCAARASSGSAFFGLMVILSHVWGQFYLRSPRPLAATLLSMFLFLCMYRCFYFLLCKNVLAIPSSQDQSPNADGRGMAFACLQSLSIRPVDHPGQTAVPGSGLRCPPCRGQRRSCPGLPPPRSSKRHRGHRAPTPESELWSLTPQRPLTPRRGAVTSRSARGPSKADGLPRLAPGRPAPPGLGLSRPPAG